jgi:hypothetical protein
LVFLEDGLSVVGKCGAGFAVLCLLASARWILADQWPLMGSTLRSEAWACGVAAMVAVGVAVARRRRFPGVWNVVELLAVGASLLAAPALGAALTGAAGAALNRTVALCFVPVLVTVLGGIGNESGVSASLWPGLAGLGGALLLFPVALPSTVLGWVGLAIPPLAVSGACVGLRGVSRGVAAEWVAALLFAGGGVCLALMEAARGVSSGVPAQAFSVWAVGLDAVVAGLAVFVVMRMEPLRYVSRYFVVPLLTIVANLAILRPYVSFRQWVGLVLMAAAALALVRMRGTGGGTSMLDLD